MKTPWLHLCTILLGASTLALAITGAFVTTNEERPLYSLGLFHPVAGTSLVILTLGLALWMSVVEQRKWMRRLGWIAFSAFVVEGLLGIPMPPRPLPVRLSHTLLAYLLFSTTVLISVFTSRVWNRGPEIVEERTGKLSLQSLSIVSCATVAVQVVLGAVFRYGVTNVIPHILGAMVVAVLSGVTGFRVKQQFPEHRSLRIAATATIGITLSQAVLGMAVLAVQVINPEDPLPVILLISAHVGTGALTLAANVVLAIQIHRNVRKARANAEESDAASTRSQSLT